MWCLLMAPRQRCRVGTGLIPLPQGIMRIRTAVSYIYQAAFSFKLRSLANFPTLAG